MPQRFRAPRGTSDVLPADQPYWRLVREAAARVARSFGYGQIDTPIFEDAGVYLRRGAAGTDLADKEIYLFEDRGGDQLALRPEGTAGVCRAYLEHGMGSWPQPVRLFYVAPNFRYDRPQAGRYRMHHQFGVEAIGDPDPAIDAEVIDLLATFYAAIGLNEWRLSLNSIGDPACRPAYVERLRAYYADKRDRLCGDCQRRYDENPLRLLDCKNEPCQPFKATAPKLVDHLCEACQAHFDSLQSYLTALEVPFALDHTLVRGLDYYTRTVFEFQPPVEGSQSSLGGGGRYDGLIEELGGPATPACGFGTGLERIILNLRASGVEPPAELRPALDVYVAVADPEAQAYAQSVGRAVRRAGFNAVVGAAGRSLRAQMRHADAVGGRFAVVVGPNEVSLGKVSLRGLREELAQQVVSVEEALAVFGATGGAGP